MLFRGLGRMVVTAKSTTEKFWDLIVLQNKIKKIRRSRPTTGRHLWSTRSDRRNTILGPKVDSEVKNQSCVWLFLDGSLRVPDYSWDM